MLRSLFLAFLFITTASVFVGCKATEQKTREAKADSQLLQKKPAPSPAKVKELLEEPQPGYNQEPGSTPGSQS